MPPALRPLGVRPARPPSAPRIPARIRTVQLAPQLAALRDRGASLDVASFDVNRGLTALGEGSYGQVFEVREAAAASPLPRACAARSFSSVGETT